MAEMQDFHASLIFADQIIDKNRGMQELPYAGSFSDRITHARKAAQEIHVIEQGSAKAGSRVRIILGNMADNFLEIV